MESDDENILLNDANRVQGRGSCLQKFKLEPALILIFFGWNLGSTIIPNQLLTQTCLTFGYNASDCAELGGNNSPREIEEKIQPHVAEILMTTSLLNSIIPAILSLFIGPWTDKFGRKKVICATFFGFSLTLGSLYILTLVSSQVEMINPWLYVLPYIPIIVVGGWPTMVVSILCYVTDLTTEDNRSLRLTIIEMLIFIGVLIGCASSSYILNMTSPSTVFLISTCCATLASCYTVVFVDESVKVIENVSRCDALKELFSPAPLVEMFKTCFKKRPFQERRILWCLIIILMFTVFTLNGAATVFYLFVREKFHWTLKEATMFDSISILTAIIGCSIGLLIFKKLLKFSDLTLAIIGIISMLIDSVMKATAETPTVMYVVSGVCMFKILTSPMCRSLISTIIPSNEIGKVYSIASAFEAVSSLVAQPLYTYIYAKTLTTFAGAFYLITAGVYVISLVLAFCVMKMRRTRETLINPYTQITS